MPSIMGAENICRQTFRCLLDDPAGTIVLTAAAVLILLSPNDTAPKIFVDVLRRSLAAKKGTVMLRVQYFDWDSIPQFKIRALAPFMVNPNFSPAKSKSTAEPLQQCAMVLVVASSRARYLEGLAKRPRRWCAQ